jgi:hypothetical protein
VRRPLVSAVLAVAGIVLAAVSVGLLTGCDTGPPLGAEAAAPQKAQDTVIHQLEALPGAKVNATIESSLDGGQNNIGVQARLPAAATVAQANALGESIERTIWLSHLDPLGLIGINITREGSSVPVLRRLYQAEIDTRPLGVKYGPRPDGLPG